MNNQIIPRAKICKVFRLPESVDERGDCLNVSGMGGRLGWNGGLGEGRGGMLSGRWSGRTGDEGSNICGDIDLRDLRRDPLCLEVRGRTGGRIGEEDSTPD